MLRPKVMAAPLGRPWSVLLPRRISSVSGWSQQNLTPQILRGSLGQPAHTTSCTCIKHLSQRYCSCACTVSVPGPRNYYLLAAIRVSENPQGQPNIATGSVDLLASTRVHEHRSRCQHVLGPGRQITYAYPPALDPPPPPQARTALDPSLPLAKQGSLVGHKPRC